MDRFCKNYILHSDELGIEPSGNDIHFVKIAWVGHNLQAQIKTFQLKFTDEYYFQLCQKILRTIPETYLSFTVPDSAEAKITLQIIIVTDKIIDSEWLARYLVAEPIDRVVMLAGLTNRSSNNQI